MQHKITYQQFLKLILDRDHRAEYFKQRLEQQDSVVRKIDRLNTSLEMGLCDLILFQIKLRQDAEFFRQQLKSSFDYSLVSLYKQVAF